METGTNNSLAESQYMSGIDVPHSERYNKVPSLSPVTVSINPIASLVYRLRNQGLPRVKILAERAFQISPLRSRPSAANVRG